MTRVRIVSLDDHVYTDKRGWAFFPFTAETDPRPAACDPVSLHVVQTEPGGVRGNHRHPHAAEWLHVFGGAARLYWEENGTIVEERLEAAGHLVYIPAGVAHAVRNPGPGPLYLVAFRDQAGPEPHTVPSRIV